MENDTRLSKPENTRELIRELRELIRTARHLAARSVNTVQVLTNFEIGRRIVEFEQQGSARAEYGKGLLKKLAAELTAEFGRGFSEDNLSLMRRFYLAYKDKVAISETVSRKLEIETAGQRLPGRHQKSETPSRKSLLYNEEAPFLLSWSHYIFLIGIKNQEERNFYEIEATKADGMDRGAGGWKMRRLAARPCEQPARQISL